MTSNPSRPVSTLQWYTTVKISDWKKEQINVLLWLVLQIGHLSLNNALVSDPCVIFRFRQVGSSCGPTLSYIHKPMCDPCPGRSFYSSLFGLPNVMQIINQTVCKQTVKIPSTHCLPRGTSALVKPPSVHHKNQKNRCFELRWPFSTSNYVPCYGHPGFICFDNYLLSKHNNSLIRRVV